MTEARLTVTDQTDGSTALHELHTIFQQPAPHENNLSPSLLDKTANIITNNNNISQPTSPPSPEQRVASLQTPPLPHHSLEQRVETASLLSALVDQPNTLIQQSPLTITVPSAVITPLAPSSPSFTPHPHSTPHSHSTRQSTKQYHQDQTILYHANAAISTPLN
jgi:hypothetical protein